jgi:hypothetical protein
LGSSLETKNFSGRGVLGVMAFQSSGCGRRLQLFAKSDKRKTFQRA